MNPVEFPSRSAMQGHVGPGGEGDSGDYTRGAAIARFLQQQTAGNTESNLLPPDYIAGAPP